MDGVVEDFELRRRERNEGKVRVGFEMRRGETRVDKIRGAGY